MGTQWRTVALSTAERAVLLRTGLDYGAIEDVLRLEGLDPLSVDDFRRLRMMEIEALAAWREERERGR